MFAQHDANPHALIDTYPESGVAGLYDQPVLLVHVTFHDERPFLDFLLDDQLRRFLVLHGHPSCPTVLCNPGSAPKLDGSLRKRLIRRLA